MAQYFLKFRINNVGVDLTSKTLLIRPPFLSKPPSFNNDSNMFLVLEKTYGILQLFVLFF